MSTLVERLTESGEEMRLFQQERAILEFTEMVCERMGQLGVNRAELARRMGKTKGYATQLLDGQANLTIRTMSDILFALSRALHFYDAPLAVSSSAPAASNVSFYVDLEPLLGSAPAQSGQYSYTAGESQW